jgi:hypothetical protein
LSDTTKLVHFDAPLEEFWVRVQLETKMRVWIDAQTKVSAAMQSPDIESINACLEAISPIIVEHNLLDAETGTPLTFSFAEMTPGQIRGVLSAMLYAFSPGGEPADPLGPTSKSPATSPKPSSTKRRSRSASPSGSSPMATP